MTENEFLLNDRITKIRSVIEKYGVDNFFISYSGGRDSCVVSHLIDVALPNNDIPRVYANTGIELNMISDFVKSQQKIDNRIIIIQPRAKIKASLERNGYPFKSKLHSHVLDVYQRIGMTATTKNYLDRDNAKWLSSKCPKILRYQFNPNFNIRISDKCCYIMKEKPLADWSTTNNKPYTVTGIMREEGGRRDRANCLSFKQNTLISFNPLAPMSGDWELWYINRYNVEISDIYKPPYNFRRTGCKGCPFALNLQNELDTLEKFFPNERKQCELIWKPVYDEYRRIGYRLRK